MGGAFIPTPLFSSVPRRNWISDPLPFFYFRERKKNLTKSKRNRQFANQISFANLTFSCFIWFYANFFEVIFFDSLIATDTVFFLDLCFFSRSIPFSPFRCWFTSFHHIFWLLPFATTKLVCSYESATNSHPFCFSWQEKKSFFFSTSFFADLLFPFVGIFFYLSQRTIVVSLPLTLLILILHCAQPLSNSAAWIKGGTSTFFVAIFFSFAFCDILSPSLPFAHTSRIFFYIVVCLFQCVFFKQSS